MGGRVWSFVLPLLLIPVLLSSTCGDCLMENGYQASVGFGLITPREFVLCSLPVAFLFASILSLM